MQSGRSRPLIGLTTYGRHDGGRYSVAQEYVEAVLRAGGAAVLLPPPPGPRDFEATVQAHLDALDAVILTGGGDINPREFGERPHPLNHAVDPERDRFELTIATRALATGLPLLGICRGLQVINTALGGTLIQHLPDTDSATLAHGSGEQSPHYHAITVCAGSQLAMLTIQSDFIAASWHHQAIDRLAPGLQIAARAPDGTIEAVETREHPFYIGVQWHPELTANTHATQQRLFDGLVNAARASRIQPSSGGRRVTLRAVG